MDFTNPNLKVAVQALVPNDSSVKSSDDLATRTTIVTTGTTADIWLTKNHPDWKLLKFEKNSESLQALSAGRGDAYAQDNLVLFSWAKQNPRLPRAGREARRRSAHRACREEGQRRTA